MKGEALKGHLDLLLLAALHQQAGHGYAIAERLRRGSGGTFDLPEGTIYPALHRLEHSGLLTSRWAEGDTRRRRVYQLTRKGARVLVQRQQEWLQFSRAVMGIVGA
ncbi:MAG: helix-turn-helix transcriptional regulator [Gemmatimonadota bacterium]